MTSVLAHPDPSPSLMLAALATSMLLACGDVPPTAGHSDGQLVIRTSTTGFDRDVDGYRVVGGPAPVDLGPDDSRIINTVPEGDLTLDLVGLDPNCVVQGDNPRRVTIRRGAPARVDWVVDCTGLGRIRVMTETSGSDVDQNGYAVVRGPTRTLISRNDTLELAPFLVTEDPVIDLQNVAVNCHVAGGARRTIQLPPDGRFTLPLNITCTPAPGSLLMSIQLDGFNLDQDGYRMVVDGQLSAPLAGTPQTVSFALGVGRHQVSMVDLQSNCGMADGPSFTVDVGPYEDLTRAVEVLCTPELALAYQGVVSIAEGWTTNVVPGLLGESPQTLDWSSDGSALAYGTFSTLNRVNPDGTARVTLLDVSSQRLAVTGPDWSLDGQRITFIVSDPTHVDGRLAWINADGSGYTELTNAALGGSPSWSPNGDSIAFAHNTDIFVIARDGTGLRSVTSGPQDDRMPRWSPDGSRIAFVRVAGASGWMLHQVDPDGSGLTTTYQHFGQMFRPSWSPSGRWFVVPVVEGPVLVWADGSRSVSLSPMYPLIYVADWRP